MGRPASIIVARRRVKVTRSFCETPLPKDRRGERLALLLHLRRRELLRAQPLLDGVLRVGLHEAFADFATDGLCFPDPLGHDFLR